MDSTAIISIIVVSAAIIIPILFSVIRSKQKKQKFTDGFYALGQSHQLKISESEHWNHYAIGIDRESLKLLYVSDYSTKNDAIVVDLNTLKSVEISEISRPVNTKSGSTNVLEQLRLKAIAKNKETPPVFIEFYNAENGSIPVHELQLATKWKMIIESSLPSQSKTN